MSYTDVTVTSAARAGTTAVLHAVQKAIIGNDDYIADTGLQFRNQASRLGILVLNTSTVDLTVQFITSATIDGLALADREEVVPAGAGQLFGPWPSSYNNTNYVDSDDELAQHTDYVQMRMKVDAADYADIVNDDVSVFGITIPG